MKKCIICQGEGLVKINEFKKEKCPECNGTGFIDKYSEDQMDALAMLFAWFMLEDEE